MTRSVKTILSSFSLVLALIISACGTTGGGAAATSTDTASVDSIQVARGTQVTFWHIQATIYGDAIAEMVKQFNETNEWGIVVNQSYKGSYQELNQAVRAALTGGGSPNVTMAYENDTLQYVNAGEIVTLDPYLASKKYGVTDAQLGDMFPGVLARQRVAAYDGKTLSWPHGNSAQGLYYNADLFAKAGITAPPATWEEFLAQARKMKSATGAGYTAMGTAKNSYYYNILRSKGITPFDPAAKTTQFGSAESVKALELLAQLYSEGLAYTAKDTEQEFTNQRAATEIGTTARSVTKLNQIGGTFKWTLALTPQDTPKQVTQLYGGNNVILDSRDPQQNLAAWLFMRWFAGTEAQAIYAARTGYSPAVKSSLDTPLLSADYQKNSQKADVFKDVFPAASILPPTPAGNGIDDMVSKTVEEVVLGRLSPQEAAKRMDTQGASLLAQQ
jgi:ABC-type glycerol-3-phosphate transport system substrate-binding protein